MDQRFGDSYLGRNLSEVYKKRHTLFSSMKEMTISLLKSDNLQLIEDFLLRRIKTKEDVN